MHKSELFASKYVTNLNHTKIEIKNKYKVNNNSRTVIFCIKADIIYRAGMLFITLNMRIFVDLNFDIKLFSSDHRKLFETGYHVFLMLFGCHRIRVLFLLFPKLRPF